VNGLSFFGFGGGVFRESGRGAHGMLNGCWLCCLEGAFVQGSGSGIWRGTFCTSFLCCLAPAACASARSSPGELWRIPGLWAPGTKLISERGDNNSTELGASPDGLGAEFNSRALGRAGSMARSIRGSTGLNSGL